ncbi:MAG: TIGR00266 family protein [Lentisphaeraceae bacterium]|nr:TIGR00266 family protein [Lentisphaeraceae bacterium]
MNIEIVHGPGSSAAKVKLDAGETLTAEGGSMISMSGDMRITTTTLKKNKGGILKAMKRMLAGENFFLNHYNPSALGGEVILSTTLPGDMMTYELDSENLIVQGGSFVACDESVDMDMNWQGFKSFLADDSLFWLNLSGSGKVIINSFGAIYPVEVDGEYIVDTGHIVAFNETLNFELTKAGGSWITAIMGGEGLVCRFKGKGTVWCQSHNANSFGSSLGSMLKPR